MANDIENIITALEAAIQRTADGGGIVEYQIGDRRVKYATTTEAVEALAKLRQLNARTVAPRFNRSSL